MDKQTFKELDRGDIIRHKMEVGTFIVDANHGDRVTAVRTIDMTNPEEWVLALKANYNNG